MAEIHIYRTEAKLPYIEGHVLYSWEFDRPDIGGQRINSFIIRIHSKKCLVGFSTPTLSYDHWVITLGWFNPICEGR